MRKPKAYISGPMTGLPDFNFPAFHAAEAKLKACGWEPLNPAREFGGAQDLPRQLYMRRDIELVLKADILVMIPGWEHSRGAAFEVMVAENIGIPAIELDALEKGFNR